MSVPHPDFLSKGFFTFFSPGPDKFLIWMQSIRKVCAETRFTDSDLKSFLQKNAGRIPVTVFLETFAQIFKVDFDLLCAGYLFHTQHFIQFAARHLDVIPTCPDQDKLFQSFCEIEHVNAFSFLQTGNAKIRNPFAALIYQLSLQDSSVGHHLSSGSIHRFFYSRGKCSPFKKFSGYGLLDYYCRVSSICRDIKNSARCMNKRIKIDRPDIPELENSFSVLRSIVSLGQPEVKEIPRTVCCICKRKQKLIELQKQGDAEKEVVRDILQEFLSKSESDFAKELKALLA